MDHFPLLPVEDEGRLNDPRLRENFIERIFALKRWRSLLAEPPTIGRLVTFHTKEKLTLLAHSPQHYRQMGKLVAAGKQMAPGHLYKTYEKLFMAALLLKATPAKHINVLQHIMGYFKNLLAADEKNELIEILEHYRHGDVPLIVPVVLANHYVRKYAQVYLSGQTYLNPHPIALRLRNYI